MRHYIMTVERPPIGDREAAVRRMYAFRRVKAKAVRKGGGAVRSTDVRWVVTLPDGVPCSLPVMQSEACTKAAF